MNNFLNKINKINEKYKCFSEIYLKNEVSEEELTVSIKDNISYKGFITSCCSKVLENYISPFDSHVVECLKKNKFIIVGSTVMDEFAMGSFGKNSLYEPCKNAHFEKKEKYKNIIPGGSSSGAAVSVATGCVNFALASSTGGSIRFPASINGVIGFKPSFGLISRYGLISFANSFDQIGFITKNVLEMKSFFSIISEKDNRDMHTLYTETNSNILITENKKINLLFLSLDDVRTICEKNVYDMYVKTINLLEKSNKFNIRFLKLSKDFFLKIIETYFVLSSIEAFSNLLRFSGNRYIYSEEIKNFKESFYKTQDLFGLNVKERILIGQSFAFDKDIKDKFVSYRNYLVNFANELKKEYSSSVFITPNSAIFPKNIENINFSQHESYDMFLPFANLIGTCAFSVPAFLHEFFGLNVMSLEKFNDYAVLDLLQDMFFVINSENKEKLVEYLPYTRVKSVKALEDNGI